MKNRKEIDGLRAIAVLPVVLFHAGILGFAGGYIGVDIFFVISGYLITSSILEDRKRNNFSIINFYERRARRILPALSVVLFFTTILAYVFMPPNLLKSYSESLISVTTFASNVFFYITSGYFSTASDEKPLLHTWSLAVEEQYYLLFPLMVIVLLPLGKKKLISIIVLLTSVSLIFSQYLSTRNADANFYLIFSRAWELFFGSIIAFFSIDTWSVSREKRELIGILGLLIIFYSIIFFDSYTPFPSFYTLAPVLGTFLIIIFVDSNTYVGRFLSNKIFVTVGLISYSLYLWHQPLFAFLRLKYIGEPPTYIFIGTSICAIFLAFLSWKYIETPFRNKINITRKSIFQYSITSIAIFLFIGFAGYFYNGFEKRFNVKSYTKSMEPSPKREVCHTVGLDYIKPINACKYFGQNITWAFFGDSHTVEPAYALARKLETSDVGLVHLSFSGCPPALLLEASRPGCSKWTNEALIYLEEEKNIKNVVLGFRYSYYLYGDQKDTYPNIPNQSPRASFADFYHIYTDQELRELFWQSFSEIVSRLRNAGKNVYILYPIPELPTNIQKVVLPFWIFSDSTMLDLKRTTDSDYYFRRNNYIISKLNTLPFGTNLHAVKPFDLLCDGEYCPAVINDKALYFDDNHLSIWGAEFIANDIINKNKKAE